MGSFVDALHLTLLDAASGLAGVGSRKMFGCQALFRHAQIFALVWQDGRLGLRLPEAAAYAALAAVEGSEPWRVGMGSKRVIMGHWLLVPEEWNDGGEDLEEWVRKAHLLAGLEPPRKARKAARAAEKPAAALAAAKKPAAASAASKKLAARAKGRGKRGG